MANKFYAVKNGRKIGVYETWAECKEQVNGYKGAEFKSFNTREEALSYITGENIKVSQRTPEENEIFAYVDGSFNVKTFEYAYGIVLINKNGIVTTLSGKDNKEEVVNMRNVAGELKGTMVAIQYISKNIPNINKVTIFHDYEGIAKWVTEEWKTNLEYTQKYKEYMKKMKQNLQISFQKVVAHTGDEFNEMADKLAKEQLGL